MHQHLLGSNNYGTLVLDGLFYENHLLELLPSLTQLTHFHYQMETLIPKFIADENQRDIL